jgi:hypothetical protein
MKVCILLLKIRKVMKGANGVFGLFGSLHIGIFIYCHVR